MAEQRTADSNKDQGHEQQGQVERARRIREQIARLKSGQSPGHRPGKSIREQVEDRVHESNKRA